MITIIFSKNRSMQLNLLLESMEKNCNDDLNINVLYSCTNKRHENSYIKLSEKYKNVIFWKENNFEEDLSKLVFDKKYVLFLCDDCIFTNKFDLNEIVQLLDQNSRTIGFSFRLGMNTRYCYSLNCGQRTPSCIHLNKNILMYKWTDADADYGYPLELSSSIYRVDDIRFILFDTEYGNPNQLEWNMFSSLNLFKQDQPLLMCYENSVAFSAPINRIQSVNNNRSGSNIKYDTESLLTEFENGGKFNYLPLNGFTSNACHQEIDLEIIYE